MIENDLQALTTGALIGAMMNQDLVDVDLDTAQDETTGDYLPEFTVTGRESGTKLRVSVELLEVNE